MINIIAKLSSLMSKKHHKPASNSPPQSAHIDRLDLHIHYEKWSKLIMSTATLTWTNPTTRLDGSVFTPDQIKEVDIFDFPSIPGVPTTNTQIGTVTGAGTTFTTGVLDVGVHNFTVVVTDIAGHMSAASNVASVTVPATQANPSAVTDLSAVLSA
jgi:hypothetical protein